MKRLMFIIDAHNHLHADWYGTKSHNGAVKSFVGRIIDITSVYTPDYMAVAFDSGPSFRKDIFPDYKIGRPEKDEDLKRQLKLARDLLEAAGIHCFEAEGFEADDICATLTEKHKDKVDGIVLCCNDKDSYQLLERGRVTIASKIQVVGIGPERGIEIKYMTADDLIASEKWGIRPDQMIDFQTLVGDSTDGIPGAKGVGPVTARTLLVKWETLDKALSMLDYTPIGDRMRKIIRDFQPQIPMVRQLVTLRRDVPLANPTSAQSMKEFNDISKKEGLSWWKDKHAVLFERNMRLDWGGDVADGLCG